MSTFKKVISLVVVVFLLAGLVVGCGSSKEKEAAANTAPAGEATTTAELPEVTLSWYFPGPWPQPDQDKVFAEANKTVKEKINATVDFKPIARSAYEQEMSVMIASGEDYDLCFTSNWTNNYISNVIKGAYAPMDDLLAEYAPKTFARVSKSFWDATRVNGKIYGFINEQISARTAAVSIPKAYIDKYGIDLSTITGKLNPFTLNILEPIMDAIRKDEPLKGCAPQISSVGGEFFGYDLIIGFKVPGAIRFDDASTKVVNQWATAEYKAYAAKMRDWKVKGYTNSDLRAAQKLDSAEMLKQTFALSFGGTFKPGGAVMESINKGQEVIQVPSGTPRLSSGGIIATMHAISINSKNPERAMMFLELLNNDQELFNTLNFGIKDVHFKLDSEGFLVKKGDEAAKYQPNMPWMFATNFLAYIDQGLPKTVWEETKEINSTAIKSPIIGFAFNPEPVKGEIAKTNAVTEEYIRSIDLGIASEKVYEEFLAKLNEAGAETIIVELQKQIDAWKATK